MEKPRMYDNKRVLTFSCTHAPFQHRDTIPFLAAVREEYNPDRVIHLGDHSDQYVHSRFIQDADRMGASEELRGVKKFTKELEALFPTLTMLKSNHDDRAYDRAREVGIPRWMLRSYFDILDMTDSSWRMVDDLSIRVNNSNRDRYYFVHYRMANTQRLSEMIGYSACQGHQHTKFAIARRETPENIYWCVDVPCLINDNRMAFGYNRQSIIRPQLGCVLILNGIPKLQPMHKKKSGRWTGRL